MDRARRRYVKAMLKAIKKARHNCWDEDNPAPMTDGLRVIRTFERVNGIKFDPFDEQHVYMVSSWGWAERSFRSLKRSFKRMSKALEAEE